MHPRFAFRFIGLLLLLGTCSWLHAGDRFDRAPLNGGCITTANQTLVFGTVPATINATAASGGLTSTYLYQWQSSTDGIHFTDIPGATSQNLSFSSSLPQTTYFQRRTINGVEAAYTGTVNVMMIATLFYNVAKSGAFTRNNCGSGFTGSTVTYTVPANTYSSTISQADADAKAQTAVNNNGQTYANSNGTCTAIIVNVNVYNWTATYFSASFKNTSTNVTYNFSILPNTGNINLGQIPAGTYNVTIVPAASTLIFEWWLGAYYLAFANTLTVNDISIIDDEGALLQIGNDN